MWNEELEYDGGEDVPVIYLVQTEAESAGGKAMDAKWKGGTQDIELILVDSSEFIPDFGPGNLS